MRTTTKPTVDDFDFYHLGGSGTRSSRDVVDRRMARSTQNQAKYQISNSMVNYLENQQHQHSALHSAFVNEQQQQQVARVKPPTSVEQFQKFHQHAQNAVVYSDPFEETGSVTTGASQQELLRKKAREDAAKKKKKKNRFLMGNNNKKRAIVHLPNVLGGGGNGGSSPPRHPNSNKGKQQGGKGGSPPRWNVFAARTTKIATAAAEESIADISTAETTQTEEGNKKQIAATRSHKAQLAMRSGGGQQQQQQQREVIDPFDPARFATNWDNAKMEKRQRHKYTGPVDLDIELKSSSADSEFWQERKSHGPVDLDIELKASSEDERFTTTFDNSNNVDNKSIDSFPMLSSQAVNSSANFFNDNESHQSSHPFDVDPNVTPPPMKSFVPGETTTTPRRTTNRLVRFSEQLIAPPSKPGKQQQASPTSVMQQQSPSPTSILRVSRFKPDIKERWKTTGEALKHAAEELNRSKNGKASPALDLFHASAPVRPSEIVDHTMEPVSHALGHPAEKNLKAKQKATDESNIYPDPPLDIAAMNVRILVGSLLNELTSL